MATKLKNMKLTSVDLMRAGANQEADICLFKSAEPPETTESPTEYETNIIKRFINWLREYPTEAQNEPQNPIEKGDDVPDLEFIYKSALTESLQSIMADETLTDIEKKNMAEESLRQYAEKIQEMEDAEEDYDGGANIDEKAVEAVDDFDKDDDPDFDDDDDEDTIEEEIIEEIREDRHERPHERYDLDEIEEVELTKYNHNHGADGKFSESPGAGGGGGSSSGKGSGKFDSDRQTKEVQGIKGYVGDDKVYEEIDNRLSPLFGDGKDTRIYSYDLEYDGIESVGFFGADSVENGKTTALVTFRAKDTTTGEIVFMEDQMEDIPVTRN